MPTVSVASKLPHGLRLQLQEPVVVNEPVMGGGFKEVTRHRHVGRVVILNGTAMPNNPIEPNAPFPIQGGFAITSGIDADFFAKWLEQNKGHPAVENGMIFAAEKQADLAAHTKDYKDELSGFEPTDPANLPSEFKRNIQKAA